MVPWTHHRRRPGRAAGLRHWLQRLPAEGDQLHGGVPAAHPVRGFTIVQFQRSFAIPEMWSGIVVLGLLGGAMSFIFQWAERNILRWYHGQKEVENAA
ncbi:hypothetical protein J2808_000144 [Pseudarthrobacter sulfonivorans]|nr:hypothetical protein [Pseudarthrobacter sulfonivorans]